MNSVFSSTPRSKAQRGLLLVVAIIVLHSSVGCARSSQAAVGGSDAGAPAELQLGDEYTTYRKTRGGRYVAQKEKGNSYLLYLPNRFLDLLDVFHFDVGIGPAYGGVLRLTRWGQMGYRKTAPWSFRLGLRGRKLPGFLERGEESGFGPWYSSDGNREISAGELGASADLGIFGVSAGLSVDGLFDFILGFTTLDVSDDDLH